MHYRFLNRFGFGLCCLTSSLSYSKTEFPFPDNSLGYYEFVSSFLCYVSEGLDVKPVRHEDCLKGNSVQISEEVVSQENQNLLKALAAQENATPPELLDWWDNVQMDTRSVRVQSQNIPDSVAELALNSNYRAWEKIVLPVSMVKRKTRVIYRSPANHLPATSIAETYESDTGDLTSPVRETEVAIERLDGSGNADFYSYDHLGRLSKTSMFPAGERPAPSVCMGCHFNRSTRTFARDGM